MLQRHQSDVLKTAQHCEQHICIPCVQPRSSALTCENAVQRAIHKSDGERALDAALQQHRFNHICMAQCSRPDHITQAQSGCSRAQERRNACQPTVSDANDCQWTVSINTHRKSAGKHSPVLSFIFPQCVLA